MSAPVVPTPEVVWRERSEVVVVPPITVGTRSVFRVSSKKKLALS
jgi:hypothetical protein